MAKRDPLTAIAKLRAAAAELERSPDPMVRELASDLRTYEVEAPSGRTLDHVIGLTQHGGACSWWAQEARQRRKWGDS